MLPCRPAAPPAAHMRHTPPEHAAAVSRMTSHLQPTNIGSSDISPQKPKFDFHKLAESASQQDPIDPHTETVRHASPPIVPSDVMRLEQLREMHMMRYNLLMWQAAYAVRPHFFHQTQMTSYTRKGRNRR